MKFEQPPTRQQEKVEEEKTKEPENPEPKQEASSITESLQRPPEKSKIDSFLSDFKNLYNINEVGGGFEVNLPAGFDMETGGILSVHKLKFENREDAEKEVKNVKQSIEQLSQEKGGRIIERSVNRDNTTIVGWDDKRNLPILKKIHEGEIVKIYDENYLVTGFIHEEKWEDNVYKLKDEALLKKVSEEEIKKIEEKKNQFKDLLELKKFIFNYKDLRDKHYRVGINDKKEIEKQYSEVKEKIDTEFFSKLEAIRGLKINTKEKAGLASLFQFYGGSNGYLYDQGVYGYRDSIERARAVEIISKLITDGAYSFKIKEKEKLKELKRKSLIDKNLTPEELNELNHLTLKSERIEQLLRPESWQEFDYEQFNPFLELKKIRHFSPEEKQSLSSEEMRIIQEKRLSKYKERLSKQKENIAEIQIGLEELIRENSSLSFDELMEFVYKKATKAELVNYQIEALKEGVRNYIKKHEAVEKYREEYRDDKELFKACFGQRPKGEIEIIKGPITLYFRCHNPKDYALIYSLKFIQNVEIDERDINMANLSGGISISASYIRELDGCIIAENSKGKIFEGEAKEIYVHEEQHAIKKLFKDEILRQDFNQALENYQSEKEKIEILENKLRTIREGFENRAKDEILAYFKTDTNPYDIRDILLESKKQDGLYDYYNQWYEKEGKKIKDETIKVGINEYYVDTAFTKVFKHEYEQEIISPAIEAILLLRNNDFPKEKIINILVSEPLSRWPKVADRLRNINKEGLINKDV